MKRVHSLFIGILTSALIINCGGGGGSNKKSGKGTTANPSDTVVVNDVLAMDNTTVKVIFDEGVTQSAAETISNYSIDNALTVISATRDINDTSIVTLTTSSQVKGTGYTLTVSNITGIDGSKLDTSANTGTFTGISPADATGPSIVNVQSMDKNTVRVRFNETIDATTLTTGAFTFSPVTGIGPNPSAVVRDPVNLSEVILTTADQSSFIYTLSVSNSVKDPAGNGVEVSGNSMSFNGTPGDTAAPTVALASLLASDDDNDNADAGSPHASILLSFSEDVDVTTATNTSNYVFSNCTTGSIEVVSVSMSGTDKVLISGDVQGGLSNGNTCKITVNNVQDLNGNTVIAGTNFTTLTYFTSSADTTKPYVVDAVPQNYTTVRVTFSEPVDSSAALSASYSFDNGLSPQSVAQVTSTAYDVTLTSGMADLTYTVTVTGVYDLASTPNPLDTNNNSASFTGDIKPSISSILVLNNTTILLIFSEPLASAGVSTDYVITGGAGLAVNAVSLYAPLNDNIVELTTGSQEAGIQYSLSIVNGSGTITDLNGNLLDSAASVSTFYSDSLPSVSSAAQVSTSSVEITFSEAVTKSTMETTANYAVSCDTYGALTETSSLQSSATTVIVTWSDVISSNDTCEVIVSGVTDLNGNLLASNPDDRTSFGFSTTDTISPLIVGAVSLNNTTVRVTYSEPVNGAGSVSNYSFSSGLTALGAAQVASTTSYDITTSPQSLTSYTLTVTGITDQATLPNALSVNTVNFTGTSPPDTLAPNVFTAVAVDNNTVDVTFDENVDLSSSQNEANYSIDNGISVISATRQADNAVVRLVVSSQTGGLNYTLSVINVQDLAGNAVASNSANFTGLPDSGPPVVLAVYQYDCDANGNIDEVTIQFDGAMNDSSISKSDASHFTMGGITFLNIDDITDSSNGTTMTCSTAGSGGVDPQLADDSYITLVADNTTIEGTVVNSITYFASVNRLEDASGNDLATFAYTSAAPEMMDKASPVLLSATTNSGTSELRLLFSEPVYGTASGSGNLAANDFSYCDDNDALRTNGCTPSGSISNITGTVSDGDGSDNVIILTATESPVFFSSSDIFKDSIAAAANSVYDVDGNAAADYNTVNIVLTGVIRPYVLAVTQIGNTTLRFSFSENMDRNEAVSPESVNAYCITTSSSAPAVFDETTCSAQAGYISINGVSAVDDKTYDLTLGNSPAAATTYYVHADPSLRDKNDNSLLTSPKFSTFVGSEAPKVLKVEATGLNTVLVTFSKPMTGGSTTACSSVENPSNYSFSCLFTPADLGGVSEALQQSDPSKVLLTTAGQQGVGYCTLIVQNESNNINPSCGSGAGSGVTDAFGIALHTNPGDRGSFEGAGGSVVNFEDGPLFTDPFADGTSFSFAFVYNNQVYLGPNDTNSGAFRFEADGANGTAATFQTSTGCGPLMTDPCFTFGDGSGTTGNDLGPFRVDGVGIFSAGFLLEDGDDVSLQENIDKQFLYLGPVERNGTQVNEFWITNDTDLNLDFIMCDIGNATSNGTQSVETIYSYGEHIWVGLAAGGSKKPVMQKLNITGGVCTSEDPTTWANGTQNIPAIGDSSNTYSAYIGIDSILVFNGKIWLASTGGLAYSVLSESADNNGNLVEHDAAPSPELPTDDTNFTAAINETGSCSSVPANWCQTDGSTTNRTLNLIAANDLTPGQKSIPFLKEYNGKLYLARNVTTSGEAGTTQNGGELWVCSANCHLPSSWSRIFTSTDKGSGLGIETTNNIAVSMLEISGGQLFIGFDNYIDGARMYQAVAPSVHTDFAETGRITPAVPCANTSDGAALGGYCYGFQFFSSSNITKGGDDYLYVSNGCIFDESDNGVCDSDGGAAGFSAPAIRVLRKVVGN